MDPWPKERKDRALRFIDLDGRGLEIGPSYSPLVTKASGARVETVDHADQATLVEKYTGYGLDSEVVARIEPVDHVWAGGSLLDVISEREAYDYILASHFIEHTIDLIGFLQDCSALLRPDGRLALVVPDKRYCFDRFQPLTTIGDVVDAHHSPTRFHPAGSLLDHHAYGCQRGDAIVWGPLDLTELRLSFPKLEGGPEAIAAGLGQGEYSDVHRWKFTPTSFDLLLRDLRSLDYHDLEIMGSEPTAGFEFFTTLVKDHPASPYDRTAAVIEIECEVAAPMVEDSLDPASVTAARNLAVREELQRLRAEVDRLRSSTSWRVTSPLRAASSAYQRIRSRGR